MNNTPDNSPDASAPDAGAPDAGSEPSIQEITNDATNAKAAALGLSSLSTGLVSAGAGPAVGVPYAAWMATEYSRYAAGVDAQVAKIAQEKIAEANIPPEYQQFADALKQEMQARQQVDQDIAAGKNVQAGQDAAADAAAYDKFATALNNEINAEETMSKLSSQGTTSSQTSEDSAASSTPDDSGADSSGDGGGD